MCYRRAYSDSSSVVILPSYHHCVLSLQFHVYNRTHEYARLEKLFHLEELMVPEVERAALEEAERKRTESTQPDKGDSSRFKWRDLIPSIKIDMNDVSVCTAVVTTTYTCCGLRYG